MSHNLNIIINLAHTNVHGADSYTYLHKVALALPYAKMEAAGIYDIQSIEARKWLPTLLPNRFKANTIVQIEECDCIISAVDESVGSEPESDVDPCSRHVKGDGSYWLNDARGIPLCRVCESCEKVKTKSYRPEIINGYTQDDVDEPIEPDDY